MKLLFYFLITFSILFCSSSCERDAPLYEVDNLNGNVISAFGHGGMGVGFKFPINCFESIEPCIRIGADGTELDIQMTKDSVLVAYHNSDLNESTLCGGTVNDKLWSQIWGCHYASPYSSTINLVSLHEIFTSLPYAHSYTYTLDCKLYNHAPDRTIYLEQYTNAIVRFINDHGISPAKIFVESQDTTFLRMLKSKQSDLPLFIYPNSFTEGFAIAKEMELFGITISNTNITKDQVKYAHENGIRVALWNTKNKEDHLNAILKSPDFLQSDDLIYLLKVFGKYKK